MSMLPLARHIASVALVFLTPVQLAGQTATTDATAGDQLAAALIKKVTAAYAKTHTYQAQILFQDHEPDGRWRNIRQTTIDLAFDRQGGKLLIAGPGGTLTINGQTIRFIPNDIANLHFARGAPPKLTYQKLAEIIGIADADKSDDHYL